MDSTMAKKISKVEKSPKFPFWSYKIVAKIMQISHFYNFKRRKYLIVAHGFNKKIHFYFTIIKNESIFFYVTIQYWEVKWS
jgi:hypothetical protein